MAKRGNVVARPLKATEYEIRYGTVEAEKGWMDLKATARNAAVQAWEFLTKTPAEQGDRCYKLKGDLGTVVVAGVDYDRWQYKPTGGGRIWYAIVPRDARTKKPGEIILERVMTGHPNETIKQSN